MAFYDQLLAEQPWSFRPTFSNAWNLSDLFSPENQTLTKALQSSISADGDVFSPEIPPYTPYSANTTPSASGVSSENEAILSKQRRNLPPLSAKIAKRKPRPSKKSSTTTFIATDPENFMRMVQQITGVNIDGDACARLASVNVLKPEPRRAADGLPTLDTSASCLISPPSVAEGAAEHYFDSFCSFPTLESSNV